MFNGNWIKCLADIFLNHSNSVTNEDKNTLIFTKFQYIMHFEHEENN